MEKNVLRPLGMTRSYFDRSPYFLLKYRSHSWELKGGKLTEDPFDFNTGITRSNGGLECAGIPDSGVAYLRLPDGRPGEGCSVQRNSQNALHLEAMWKPLLPITSNDEESRMRQNAQVATSFLRRHRRRVDPSSS